MGNQEVVLNPPGAEKVSTAPGAWLVAFISYIASVVTIMNFMKVSPVMPDLIAHFKVDLSGAGLMMSVVSFCGIVLGLPAGVFVQKYGIRSVAMMAMAISTIGCVLGAMATNYPVFLVSRGLEGIGFAFMALVGPTIAGIWFPPQKVGVVMGLVTTCMGVAGFITMAAAPRIAHNMGGWRSLWWFTAALSFLSLVLVVIFVRMPPWMTAAPAGGSAPQAPSLGAGLANRNIWLWAAAFFCAFLPYALFMYYVTYLTKVQGYTMEKAGLISSLGSVGTLLGALLAGILIGKIGIKHLKLTLAMSIVIYCVLLTLSFNISGIAIPVWMTAMGVIGMGGIPVLCMTAVPGIMRRPELMGIGVAIAGFGANTAGMIGPPVFGAIVDKAGWNAGAYAFIPVALIGIFFASITKTQHN